MRNRTLLFVGVSTLVFLFLFGYFLLPVKKGLTAPQYKTESNAVTTLVGSPPTSTGKFTFYCEGDPAWKNECGISTMGCGPTSMAMIATAQGIRLNPVEMDRIFRQGGGRACNGVTSSPALFENSWFKENFTKVDLTYNKPLDLTLAKRYLDEGYLIYASHQNFPCWVGRDCKNPNGTVDHIFVVDGVDVANNMINVRDPINCNRKDLVEIPGNIRMKNFDSWYYAYAIKRK